MISLIDRQPWRLCALSALFLLLSSCSTRPIAVPVSAGLKIDGVIIRNRLAYSVNDVQILAPVTGNFVSCGLILARSSCSTGFPDLSYTSNPVRVTWTENGEPQATDDFVVEIGDEIDAGRPAYLEVQIFSPGQAGANLIQ